MINTQELTTEVINLVDSKLEALGLSLKSISVELYGLDDFGASLVELTEEGTTKRIAEAIDFLADESEELTAEWAGAPKGSGELFRVRFTASSEGGVDTYLLAVVEK